MSDQMRSFEEELKSLCQKDGRYSPDAYLFVLEAMDVAVKSVRKKEPSRGRNITAGELLQGIKDYALSEFGPMAYAVLTQWGLRETADFGEIVFNLVAIGRLGKTENDKREDFKDIFTFQEAFVAPYQ